jgi:hypothetical protein
MFILMVKNKTENCYSVTQYTNFTNVSFTFKILNSFMVHVISFMFIRKYCLRYTNLYKAHIRQQEYVQIAYSKSSTGICADCLQQILCNQTINADARDIFFYSVSKVSISVHHSSENLTSINTFLGHLLH